MQNYVPDIVMPDFCEVTVEFMFVLFLDINLTLKSFLTKVKVQSKY